MVDFDLYWTQLSSVFFELGEADEEEPLCFSSLSMVRSSSSENIVGSEQMFCLPFMVRRTEDCRGDLAEDLTSNRGRSPCLSLSAPRSPLMVERTSDLGEGADLNVHHQPCYQSSMATRYYYFFVYCYAELICFNTNCYFWNRRCKTWQYDNTCKEKIIVEQTSNTKTKEYKRTREFNVIWPKHGLCPRSENLREFY